MHEKKTNILKEHEITLQEKSVDGRPPVARGRTWRQKFNMQMQMTFKKQNEELRGGYVGAGRGRVSGRDALLFQKRHKRPERPTYSYNVKYSLLVKKDSYAGRSEMTKCLFFPFYHPKALLPSNTHTHTDTHLCDTLIRAWHALSPDKAQSGR